MHSIVGQQILPRPANGVEQTGALWRLPPATVDRMEAEACSGWGRKVYEDKGRYRGNLLGELDIERRYTCGRYPRECCASLRGVYGQQNAHAVFSSGQIFQFWRSGHPQVLFDRNRFLFY